ncbi:MAG: trypsin-like serine peptidase, partial [bacterium]
MPAVGRPSCHQARRRTILLWQRVHGVPPIVHDNHHVLPSAEVAARTTVEFDYQRDRLGREVAFQAFELNPASFFLNDKELDFALVAGSPDGPGRALDDYMWCPLLKEPGKIVAGEPINIIQHPKGERKQVVIRENRLLDALEGAELFYHYEADTEPGSSGSPVFNDQWKVVALHHSGVPKRNNKGELLGTDGKVWRKGDDPSRLDWVANEGVRVSKLVEFIAKASMAGAAKPLLKTFLDAKPPGVETESSGPIRPPHAPPEPNNEEDLTVSGDTKASGSRSVTLTVPLHITFTLGVPGAGSTDAIAAPARPGSEPDEGLEKVEIDPDYGNRLGYDPDFLGFKVPFPRLTNTSRRKAFALPGV